MHASGSNLVVRTLNVSLFVTSAFPFFVYISRNMACYAARSWCIDYNVRSIYDFLKQPTVYGLIDRALAARKS